MFCGLRNFQTLKTCKMYNLVFLQDFPESREKTLYKQNNHICKICLFDEILIITQERRGHIPWQQCFQPINIF